MAFGDDFSDMGDPLVPQAFDVIGTVIAIGGVVVLLGVVASIAVAVCRAQRMGERGQNPLTLQEDLAYQASRSATLAPAPVAAQPVAQSLEQRLAELDDLHRRGVISDEEHRTARADVLRG
jgi:hypothetical protein